MSKELLAIDINADMGERPEALRDGSEEELMRLITSANIACGGHAGDASSMEATVQLAKKYGVSVGAHPGFPDRENFGRIEMALSRDEIRKAVYTQITALGDVCRKLRCDLNHVKPHGALYNVAVKKGDVAEAIAEGTRMWSTDVVLVGLAGSTMIQIWKDAGFRVAEEAFVDRTYEADGTLRSRIHTDALLQDPAAAADRAVSLVKSGMITAIDGTVLRLAPSTLCIHSDTPGSDILAKILREGLKKGGIAVRPMTALV